MISIRWFLTLTLIALLVLVSFLSSLRGYRESMAEAETLFDLQLLEHVKLLGLLNPASFLFGNTLVIADSVISTPAELELSLQLLVVYQIFDNQEKLVIRSENSPTQNMAVFAPGYHHAEFNGYSWRALVAQDPGDGHWIMAAQRNDVRYRLAETVTLQAVLPGVIGVPIAGVLIWWIVGLGLRPIQTLAASVRAREEGDLKAVELDDVPQELTPLTLSTNDLLTRLAMAFDREKRFAADAAHELRTPISVLKVQLHNLLHDLNTRQLPEPVLQPARLSLQELGDGIDRLAHLIEQILVLNRTAPAQYMRQFLPVDLLELVQHVVSNEFDHFLARDQIFSLDGLPISIAGDKTALQSLVQNLLINASKYTPAGGQINVAIGREGSKVVLQIEDSGPGIPEAQYEQVFDRFYRLSDEQHDLAVSGSGLGLAIVKHIVNMHQAEIRLSRSLSLGGLCVTVLFKQYPQEKSV